MVKLLKKELKSNSLSKAKKYIGKTNKKGVAKVIIKKKVLKKLKVGKKVKYTAKYSTKTVKRTAKVKR
jgi:invasion protein IalB